MRHTVLKYLALICLAFFLAVGCAHDVQASGASPKLPQVGFRSLSAWRSDSGDRINIAVWYPTTRAPRDIAMEGWTFRAAKDAAGIPGRYPVILISHDAAASRLSSYDVAISLARNGFIVIAPTHPKDNVLDTSYSLHATIFADRPQHLVLAFEAAAHHTALGQLMDTSRVGVLGMGAGAATALQLAGAAPDMERLKEYCTQTSLRDPLCSNWAKTLHIRMRQEFSLIAATTPEAFTPSIEKKKQPLAPDAPLTDIAAALAPPPPSAPLQADPAPNHTPNEKPAEKHALPREVQPILAVGLLAPGFSGLFSDDALRDIHTPVGIFTAANDSIYPSEHTLERLQALLPQRPASRTMPDTDHFDLQPPCPPIYQDTFAALCGEQTNSAPETRQIRNDFFIRFYQKHLGAPMPPPLLPKPVTARR